MSTEKRLFLFLVLTFVVLAGYSAFIEFFGPKPPPVEVAQDADPDGPKEGVKDGAKDNAKEPPPRGDVASSEEKPASEAAKSDAAKSDAAKSDAAKSDSTKAEAPSAEAPVSDATAPALDRAPDEAQRTATHPHRIVSLGTFRPGSDDSPLLVTLNSLGGSLERVELVGRDDKNQLRYRDLDNFEGYLGNLSLIAEDKSCRIQVVPPGTPAAEARPATAGAEPGLRADDILVQVNERLIETPSDLNAELNRYKVNDKVLLEVRRMVDGASKVLAYEAVLGARPFQLIKPDPLFEDELEQHPPSLLLALGEGNVSSARFKTHLGGVEWQTEVAAGGSRVEFRYDVSDAEAKEIGLKGPVRVTKRYQLGKRPDPEGSLAPYHLDFDIEVQNLATEPQNLSYRLQGPNGLPTEGWWYLTKLHPRWFNSAGARDIVIGTGEGPRLIGASALLSQMREDEKSPQTPLFSDSEPIEFRSVDYIGVDTQYFAAVLQPVAPKDKGAAEFARAEAYVLDEIGTVPKGWERTANSTFQLTSVPRLLNSDDTTAQRFRLFLGPKSPSVLETYGLDNLIYYGWAIFGYVARLLASILHFFYGIVGNYGIAIVLLTVLVRSCMFPISRTAARNAAMMQELAPEMRKIAEKHKNDFEARSKAQQELFRQHSYNPLGGCWLMFLQLPVFIGLYRCLAVDIELRQAPLIPGLEWCSNLAGPDKLFYWKPYFFGYFTDESGWLGPYFNLLPIFTVILFLLHQKLFTPPATDEQTEMQMKMMKFMTIFMGVLFYKVPAGLCLYFITSSLWGIAERKLIPKPKPRKLIDGSGPGAAAAPSKWNLAALQSMLKPPPPPQPDNGNARKKELARKMRKK